MVLIIILSVNGDKISSIISIFKRKIKQRLFTVDLVQRTIDEYGIIFAPYLKYFLDIIDSFLKDRDHLLMEFGYASYKYVFNVTLYEYFYK